MEKLLNTVCVFCGASQNVDYVYQDSAIVLGKELATNNYNLVYGGGKTKTLLIVVVGSIQIVKCPIRSFYRYSSVDVVVAIRRSDAESITGYKALIIGV